jgi:hypothetical protein
MSRLCILLMLIAGALPGCSTSSILLPHVVELSAAPEDIAEAHLLDVGIIVFDPGVPDGDIDKETLEELIERGTFVHIRRVESIYMAVQLRNVLQKSGYWGTVWVTPNESIVADVNITAEILQSDGHIARLEVRAVDTTGGVWIDKRYEFEAVAGVYDRRRYPALDPYQDLFNTIANDLARARAKRSVAEARDIQTVGAVRYAHSLSPDRFDGYVQASRRERYELERLPAADDPMFERTQSVRQRERLLLEALNQHYDAFAREVEPTYSIWRESAREEAASVRDLTRSARWQKALGLAATAASVASFVGGGLNPSSFAGSFVRETMMLMGADMLGTSAAHTHEKRLHAAALEELSASFNDEAAPRVVEIAGVQRRLTGTADMQFAQWRDLLQRIFTGEAPAEADDETPPALLEEIVYGDSAAVDSGG